MLAIIARDGLVTALRTLIQGGKQRLLKLKVCIFKATKIENLIV